jgi:hypothetical protein
MTYGEFDGRIDAAIRMLLLLAGYMEVLAPLIEREMLHRLPSGP